MRDWTTGSITRNLLALSWPMVLTEFLYTFGISVDMIWVGRLGQVAMAGIGVAGLFAGFQMMIMTGLSIGTRAVVARFWARATSRGPTTPPSRPS
jgi:Na+-driven multidrug efflux pump